MRDRTMKLILLIFVPLLILTCEKKNSMDKMKVEEQASGPVVNTQEKQTVMQNERFELAEPGPMIPPVPAIVLGVKGDSIIKDDITIVWTFILEGNPPYIGISVPDNSAITGEEYVALKLLKKHGEFTLNVPDGSWIKEFDQIDMTASTREDKFETNGLTRLPSKLIGAPGIAEAAIVLECKVLQSHSLPPQRMVFFAEVVRTSVHPGVTDEAGRLITSSRDFYGMTAGNGEFWTFDKEIGHIGITKGIDHIRY